MILEDIILNRKEEYRKKIKKVSYEDVKKKALNIEVNTDFPFLEVLKKKGISLICEIKKASPSKGIISKDFPYLQIAKEYELGKASAISVLTEPDFFMGADKYLNDIKKTVKIPILRKDFIFCPYQIYEAKVIGADAILLIVSILDDESLKRFIILAESLGMSALVECHTKEEIAKAIKANAKIIGVNNRDLKTFNVNINNSIRLRKYVSNDIIFVAESGIKNREDIEALEKGNVDAALIGESLMISKNRVSSLKTLRGDDFE